ncbi:MAG: hypothetical protein WBD32_10120 [Acidobacteriaceae bacterium]
MRSEKGTGAAVLGLEPPFARKLFFLDQQKIPGRAAERGEESGADKSTQEQQPIGQHRETAGFPVRPWPG